MLKSLALQSKNPSSRSYNIHFTNLMPSSRFKPILPADGNENSEAAQGALRFQGSSDVSRALVKIQKVPNACTPCRKNKTKAHILQLSCSVTLSRFQPARCSLDKGRTSFSILHMKPPLTDAGLRIISVTVLGPAAQDALHDDLTASTNETNR